MNYYSEKSFPQIVFRVKTYDDLEFLSRNLPDSDRQVVINQRQEQAVWIQYIPYPLKNGDLITLYGEEAINNI